jgi:hypothetical protein
VRPDHRRLETASIGGLSDHPGFAFVEPGSADEAVAGLVNGQAAGCLHFRRISPYASDPGRRRPAAAIRAGWVRFVQQQQPAPAGKQHNHHRAAGNDARPLLTKRRRLHVETRTIEHPPAKLWDSDRGRCRAARPER